MFDLVELFCRIDDFWKNFESLWLSYLISHGKFIPKRPSSLSMSKVMIILILFHFDDIEISKLSIFIISVSI